MNPIEWPSPKGSRLPSLSRASVLLTLAMPAPPSSTTWHALALLSTWIITAMSSNQLQAQSSTQYSINGKTHGCAGSHSRANFATFRATCSYKASSNTISNSAVTVHMGKQQQHQRQHSSGDSDSSTSKWRQLGSIATQYLAGSISDLAEEGSQVPCPCT